ncbi:MAG: ATP phosphoribosyltransferase [Proteobacteria bacterium]|nr:ATP phosphoribosyltransferase [Pseudomonadota bacterium]
MLAEKELIIAIPKGRILDELHSLFEKIGLVPEEDFYNDSSRKLFFSSNFNNLKIIKVRSFDVATFVKFGAADIGICGLDVVEEFDSPDIYRILNLGIGKCRLSIASKKGCELNLLNESHVRIASKYTNITSKYFANRGIQAECIKLNGAMELAPKLNLCDLIVDLVSSGRTLKENDLVEVEAIMDISSYLVANRNSFKAKNKELNKIISLFSDIT